ncbi:hypothetical protein [Roseivirga pacifica]|uniref:hypothetical protein n=1 Tax=Roseivirga pacifica TaxID=1267423 RepID=UPI002095E4C4|nr:hypothetical protein [Roseivirga pacifica]MCO6366639.1 hypothetical protein [Roseivirga pacifica]MCO6369303.1 hypothetical protein [Roseivirga pacifica]MCO6378495.1 hypothetical protein [Roseivirga pacifica]
MEYSEKEIKASRADALEKIKTFLEADDVDGQFQNMSGEYHSPEKFVVTWKGHWMGIASEFGIDLVDSFYTSYSGGVKCIYVTRSLFHEKEIKSFRSVERGLLEAGMTLCPNLDKKYDFFERYGLKYNEKIKAKKNDPQRVHS